MFCLYGCDSVVRSVSQEHQRIVSADDLHFFFFGVYIAGHIGVYMVVKVLSGVYQEHRRIVSADDLHYVFFLCLHF